MNYATKFTQTILSRYTVAAQLIRDGQWHGTRDGFRGWWLVEARSERAWHSLNALPLVWLVGFSEQCALDEACQN